MKLYLPMIFLCPLTSLPARGAWIEIAYQPVYPLSLKGRSPHGERGLK